jgi:1-acyl-sn-glycerol-3-phosphate acyltransferase
MTIANRITNAVLRGIFSLTCKIDRSQFDPVPENGPFILVINHLSALEAPLLYLFLRPRRTIALAKKELWGNAFTRKIMQWWECIPLDRDGMDRQALNEGFRVLKNSDILCIAPEGTRSPDNMLIEGKAGTSFIASKSGVPILPIANWGIEDFTKNIKRLRRTRVHFKVGTPFVIKTDKKRFSAEERQQITDEMMIRIAELLPESYRGFYAERIGEPRQFTADVSLEELQSPRNQGLQESP